MSQTLISRSDRQSSRKKRAPRIDNTIGDTLLLLIGNPQKPQAKQGDNIHSEDLTQTYLGSVIATSDSVSTNEPCVVDSLGHVLLVFLNLLLSTILPVLLLPDLLSYGWFWCRPLCLFPSFAGINLSNSNLARSWSMNTAESLLRNHYIDYFDQLCLVLF